MCPIARLAVNCLLLICVAQATRSPLIAGEYTLFAQAVNVVDGWNWEDNAAGPPTDRCHDSEFSAQCIHNQSPASRSTAILTASNFSTFSLPANEVITDVFVDVHGGWDANVSGAIIVFLMNYPSPRPRFDDVIGRTCDWYLGPWRITDVESPGTWTAAKVNALQVGVRRNSGTTPATPLWIDSFKIIVHTAPTNVPDLTITNITHTPAQPVVGQTVQVFVTIHNNSSFAALSEFEVDLFENSIGVPSDPCFLSDNFDFIADLPANMSSTLQFEVVYYSAGTKRLWAFADGCGEIVESNETNNSASHELSIAPVLGNPDLTITSITHTPAQPVVGQTVQVFVTIHNNSSFAALSEFEVDLFENSIGVPSDPCFLSDNFDFIEDLPANMSSTLQFEVVYYSAGTKRLWAFADGCGEIVESNETNNSASHELSIAAVLGNPDLTITSITHTPAQPVVGQTVNVSVTVLNDSNFATLAPFSVVLDEHSIGLPSDTCDPKDPNELVLSLAAHTSTTIGFSVVYDTPGTKRLWGFADGCGEIVESNETNNSASHELIIAPVLGNPDLTITSITYTPAQPVVGQTVQVFVTIHNNSSFAALSEFEVDLFENSIGVPSDPCFLSDNFDFIEDLPANMSSTLQFEVVYYSAGTKRLWAFADGCGEIVESNESNNIASQNLTVAELACQGDVDGDRTVDLRDLAILLIHFGTSAGATHTQGDLTGDGAVNLPDLSLLLSTFGTTCP